MIRLLIFCFLLTPLHGWGQDTIPYIQLRESQGIFYLNNQPFTGMAIDSFMMQRGDGTHRFIGASLRLVANFKDGMLHGNYQETGYLNDYAIIKDLNFDNNKLLPENEARLEILYTKRRGDKFEIGGWTRENHTEVYMVDVYVYKCDVHVGACTYPLQFPYRGKAIARYAYRSKLGRLQGSFQNGTKHGPWTVWFSNGNKHKEFNFIQGKKDGLLTTWYETGQKSYEGMRGTKTRKSFSKYWYQSGQLAERSKGEKTINWNDKGLIIKKEWTINGQPSKTISYVYDEDGDLIKKVRTRIEKEIDNILLDQNNIFLSDQSVLDTSFQSFKGELKMVLAKRKAHLLAPFFLDTLREMGGSRYDTVIIMSEILMALEHEPENEFYTIFGNILEYGFRTTGAGVNGLALTHETVDSQGYVSFELAGDTITNNMKKYPVLIPERIKVRKKPSRRSKSIGKLNPQLIKKCTGCPGEVEWNKKEETSWVSILVENGAIGYVPLNKVLFLPLTPTLYFSKVQGKWKIIALSNIN